MSLDRWLNQNPMPVGEFDIIYADPPWDYGQKKNCRVRGSPKNPTGRVNINVNNYYETMKIKAIKKIDPPSALDSLLFLWSTSFFLPSALEVVKAWGFQHKSQIIWHKLSRNGHDSGKLGRYVHLNHELLLIGTKGSIDPPLIKPPSVFTAQVIGHSRKPSVVYRYIEDMYPNTTRLELFAREKREGWTVWGNEIPKFTQTLLKTPQPRDNGCYLRGTGGV